MLHASLSKRAWQRTSYGMMSVLVTWHTLAIVLAAVPDSDISRAARVVLGPYLGLFRLDNQWDFFAPTVNPGQQLRYIVEDAAGDSHTFTAGSDMRRFLPSAMWFKFRDQAVMSTPEVYADAVVAALCLDHASLDPVAITLMKAEQKDYWPSDRLSGKDPLDPEFVTVETLKTLRCPGK
jgi:hypothetical protein